MVLINQLMVIKWMTTKKKLDNELRSVVSWLNRLSTDSTGLDMLLRLPMIFSFTIDSMLWNHPDKEDGLGKRGDSLKPFNEMRDWTELGCNLVYAFRPLGLDQASFFGPVDEWVRTIDVEHKYNVHSSEDDGMSMCIWAK